MPFRSSQPQSLRNQLKNPPERFSGTAFRDRRASLYFEAVAGELADGRLDPAEDPVERSDAVAAAELTGEAAPEPKLTSLVNTPPFSAVPGALLPSRALMAFTRDAFDGLAAFEVPLVDFLLMAFLLVFLGVEVAGCLAFAFFAMLPPDLLELDAFAFVPLIWFFWRSIETFADDLLMTKRFVERFFAPATAGVTDDPASAGLWRSRRAEETRIFIQNRECPAEGELCAPADRNATPQA